MERSRQLGRGNNKLRNDINNIESQQVSNLHSIKRDQKILKQELDHVKSSSGHLKATGKSLRTLAASDGSKKKVESHYRFCNPPKSNAERNKQNKGTSKLPKISKQRPKNISRSLTNVSDVDFMEQETEQKLFHTASVSNSQKRKEVPITELKRKVSKENTLTKISRENTLKSELTVYEPWGKNMDEVRSNINNRLSNSMNELSSSDKAGASPDQPHLTPFMYQHPDGTPRTMFTMPSFEERFQQAMCARYIRKPGTKLDPIEKELDLDEIFDRKK